MTGRPTRRILHLASHTGNLGDNISHIAFRALLNEHLEIAYTDVEIRQYYRNAGERHFDRSFIELANSHDAVLIGGGALLFPEVPDSSTGTTLDIWTDQIRSQLLVPIVLNAVGCLSLRPPDAEAQHKLADFLTQAVDEPRYHIFLRYDGSEAIVEHLIGGASASNLATVPDPGIAVHDVLRPPKSEHLPSEYLAINLAGDSTTIRYGPDCDYLQFIAAICRLVADSPLPVVFVPHIAQDLAVIGDILRQATDFRSRRNIWVAPFGNGTGPATTALGIYRHATGILATRFHGVIPNLASDTPLKAIITAPNLKRYLKNLHIRNGLEAVIHDTHTLLNQLLNADHSDNSRTTAANDQIDTLRKHARYVGQVLEDA